MTRRVMQTKKAASSKKAAPAPQKLQQQDVKGVWTDEEDDILERAQAVLGNKWTEIASLIPGRSANAVKNRWRSSTRRRVASKAQAKAREAAKAKAASKVSSSSRRTPSPPVKMDLDEAADVEAEGDEKDGKPAVAPAVAETAVEDEDETDETDGEDDEDVDQDADVDVDVNLNNGETEEEPYYLIGGGSGRTRKRKAMRQEPSGETSRPATASLQLLRSEALRSPLMVIPSPADLEECRKLQEEAVDGLDTLVSSFIQDLELEKTERQLRGYPGGAGLLLHTTMESASLPMMEAKLLVLGDHLAGKTALVDALAGTASSDELIRDLVSVGAPLAHTWTPLSTTVGANHSRFEDAVAFCAAQRLRHSAGPCSPATPATSGCSSPLSIHSSWDDEELTGAAAPLPIQKANSWASTSGDDDSDYDEHADSSRPAALGAHLGARFPVELISRYLHECALDATARPSPPTPTTISAVPASPLTIETLPHRRAHVRVVEVPATGNDGSTDPLDVLSGGCGISVVCFCLAEACRQLLGTDNDVYRPPFVDSVAAWVQAAAAATVVDEGVPPPSILVATHCNSPQCEPHRVAEVSRLLEKALGHTISRTANPGLCFYPVDTACNLSPVAEAVHRALSAHPLARRLVPVRAYRVLDEVRQAGKVLELSGTRDKDLRCSLQCFADAGEVLFFTTESGAEYLITDVAWALAQKCTSRKPLASRIQAAAKPVPE